MSRWSDVSLSAATAGFVAVLVGWIYVVVTRRLPALRLPRITEPTHAHGGETRWGRFVEAAWHDLLPAAGFLAVGAVIAASVNVLVMSVVGGLGHPIGAFIGSMIFTVFDTFAATIYDRDRFNTLIGLVFLVIVLVSPDGAIGIGARLRRMMGGRPAPSAEGTNPRVPRPTMKEETP